MKILLAEDDSNISTIAKMALEQLGGHQVTVAEDGEIALNKALHNHFDLILLDEMMPKMNGLRVCQEYFEKSQNRSPVIFLSAKSQESDIADFESLALGFIPKPFDPTQINSQILALMEQQGQGKMK